MRLVLLLVLSALWGASYTFIRVGVETIPPLTFMAARTALAGCMLLAWMRISGHHMPREPAAWKQFGLQALLNSVVPFTLIAWAEREVEAAVAAILNSTSPVLAFAGTWMWGRGERVTRRQLLGVALGLTGTCLVLGPSALEGLGGQLIAQLAIVAATACYAGAAIYGRTFQRLHPAVPAAGSMIVGALLLVPASVIVDRPWSLRPSEASLLALAALAVFSTALALVIYFRLVNTLGPVGTTAQAYLRVPIAVLIGVVFLGESLPAHAWWGLACVVIGVAAMSMPAPPVLHGPASYAACAGNVQEVTPATDQRQVPALLNWQQVIRPPGASSPQGADMLHYAVIFLVIALIAAVFGFGGIAAGAVGIAKILFFVFIIMAVVAFVVGRGRP